MMMDRPGDAKSMNWVKWKDRFSKKVNNPICKAILSRFPGLLHVGIDFRNAVIRVGHPGNWRNDELDDIEGEATRLWQGLGLLGRLDVWFDTPLSYLSLAN